MVFLVVCPHCGRQFVLAEIHSDRPLRCPGCSKYLLVRTPAAPAPAGAYRGAPPASQPPAAVAVPPTRDGRVAAAGRAPAPARPPARGGVPTWVWLAGGGGLLSFLLCGCLAGGLTLRSFVFREAAPADGQPAAAPPQAAARGPGEVAPKAPGEDATPGKPTIENVARIRPGMTEEEVKALLGEPAEVSDSKQLAPLLPLIGKEAGDDPHLRVLVWKPRGGQISVSFLGGKLSLSSATLRGEKGTARPGAVTAENFVKLKYGTLQAEARQLLGPPALLHSVGIHLEGGGSGTALIWRQGRDSIDARFDGDRLSSAVGLFGGKTLQVDAPAPEGLLPWIRPGGQRLTRALADSLKPGMDLQDVLIQLGPGVQPLGPQDMPSGRKSRESWKYTDGPASLTLHFVDGKLAEKEENNLPGP